MLAGSPMVVTRNQVAGTLHAIPLSLWNAIMGFHRQVSIDHNAESVSYHRWCEEEQRYHSLIPYQKTHGGGLSVSVNWADVRNVKLLDEYGRLYGRDFLPACTIHTHVNAAAFESGTDAADEEMQPGWHITLGKLLHSPNYDFDFRLRLPKTPKIARLARNDCKYPLTWKNLFFSGTEEAAVFRCPGTTDWFDKLDRIQTI